MLSWFAQAQKLQGKNSVFILLVIVLIALDQVSKLAADHWLVYGQQNEVFFWFNLTLLYNPGAAFSFLADQGGWQRWFFTALASAISIGLMIWIRLEIKRNGLLALALSFILSGALGNLVDRVAYGHVIDFIQVHWQQYYFPAFNIADSAITIGAILFIIDGFFMQSQNAQKTA